VKFYTRGLALSILSLGLLFMVGCGADNETEGEKLAKTAGDPGAPDPRAVTKAAGPLPTSPEEHYKNQQQNNSLKGKYPGKSTR